MTGRGALAIGALLAVGLGGAVWAEGAVQPAELPSADYAGLQYVDSQGCVFLRAGTEAETLWVPRVTAGGAQLCGYPPSGQPVPVAGEAGAEAAVEPVATEATVASEPAEAGPYVVALGSFGFASNVTKAKAAADALGYPVVTGQLSTGEQGLVTVFAGPFARRAEALDALERLHSAGFPDAIVMQQ